MPLNIGDICAIPSNQGNKVALRLVRADHSTRDFSFAEVDAGAASFARVIRDAGVSEGEVVALLLPKCAEVFFAFLGTLKAGCRSLPLFVSFGELALLDRLADSRATCIVSKRSLLPRLQRIRPQLPALRTILLIDEDQDQSPEVLSLPARMRAGSGGFKSVEVTEDTPSVLHYTSGSTGKPKGVLHRHGAATSIRQTATEILQLQPDDIYWCTADHGWVTGTSYGIIAPWLLGVTQVQFTGNFDAAAWMRVLQNEKITVWYTAPTALRMLMAASQVDYASYDLSRVRNILSVGEPLNPEVSRWGLDALKHDIHDTWFQTETGAIMIANRPGLPIRHGSMGRPITGMTARILDDAGNRCPPRVMGRLCLQSPWPSMFVTYLNRPEAYASKFSNGIYDSGDLAFEDEDGYVWFAARADDVINTSGHLVSPFEVESALLEMPEIAESAAVGVPDEIAFERIVVFVALRAGNQPDEDLALRVRLHVANRLSSVASPRDVVFVDSIPKNNSGKILRRVLRARYQGLDPGDLSTLQDGS
jgi:acetyl-CoA synthetase